MPEHETITDPADLHPSLAPLIDANGNELIEEGATASAVNHVRVTNAAASGDPKLEAMGADTDIDLELDGKGAGVVRIVDQLECAVWYGFAVGAETGDITTGADKLSWRFPFGVTIVDYFLELDVAPTGAAVIADVNVAGTTTMTTSKLQVDAGDNHSKESGTPHALTTTSAAAYDQFTLDFDQVGSTEPGEGPKFWIKVRRAA